MAGVAEDDVVEHFYFQKLASADEVAGDLDVGFARRGFSARVVVLCAHPSYVQLSGLSSQTSRFGHLDQPGFFT